MKLKFSSLIIFTVLTASTAVSAQAQRQTVDQFYEGKLTFSPEEEGLYLKRYAQAINRVAEDELYTPLEAMAGAVGWKPLPVAKATERTISDDAIRQAVSYAAKNKSNALIIWRNGKIESESYFDGHSATKQINSFSLAKPVTAIAVGRAMMLGKIKSLDQPVADFVSEWKSDPRRSKILVRHLLDMRAGFLAQLPPQGPTDILSRSFLHPRHDEIIVKEYPVVDEPGTRYEYNNAASEMVAVLIERATGRRYAEFVGTEIWQKIGAMGGTVWVNREGGVPHAGCCMLVPPESFLRLAILTLYDGVWNGQRLLPQGYVTEMKTPTVENPYYGLGLYVAGRFSERRGPANPDRQMPKTLHTDPYLARDLYLFDGNMHQVVYVIPSQNLVILRTGKNPPRSAESEWDNAFLPNTLIRGIVSGKGTSVPQPR
jgi:CubicO group peptidase (beta-lactamase class C family)